MNQFPITVRPNTVPKSGDGRNYFSAGFTRRRFLAGTAATVLLLGFGTGLNLFTSTPASAATATFELTQNDVADLTRVEQYLNSFSTLRARFQQYSVGSGDASGDIYVRRPGRLRVEYEPPVPVLIVADGMLVSYYDSDLDQVNQLPLNASPIWFLLRETILFDEEITVTKIDRQTGTLRVSMHQTDDADAGSVTLIFNDNPLELKQWTLVDAQGTEVRVGLEEVSLGGALANELFRTPTPRTRYE
ncbi:MAG: outer membrane lipoprotein carrier protein LolA [Rhodospirillaceae bacterium]|nr:outer membrane lipoprotein carrier protein LolA [Rhodospirillaceae bacterium]